MASCATCGGAVVGFHFCDGPSAALTAERAKVGDRKDEWLPGEVEALRDVQRWLYNAPPRLPCDEFVWTPQADTEPTTDAGGDE